MKEIQIVCLIEESESEDLIFRTLYLFSCLTMALGYKKPANCEKILEIGSQVFPESWRINVTRGYIYAFELSQTTRGAFYYHKASELPGAPDFVEKLAATLVSDKSPSEDERNDHLKHLIKLPGWEVFLEFADKQRQKR